MEGFSLIILFKHLMNRPLLVVLLLTVTSVAGRRICFSAAFSLRFQQLLPTLLLLSHRARAAAARRATRSRVALDVDRQRGFSVYIPFRFLMDVGVVMFHIIWGLLGISVRTVSPVESSRLIIHSTHIYETFLYRIPCCARSMLTVALALFF